MKEVEILSAILLLVTGAIVIESGYGPISILLGALLLGAGVFAYVSAVDSLDESPGKQEKRKNEDYPLDYL